MAEYPLVDNTIFEADEEYMPQPEPEPEATPAWLDGSVRIGIHTSIAGGHRNALETAKKLGQRAADIFGESAEVAGRVGANFGVGCTGISGAAGRIRNRAAGHSRKLPD